MYERANIANALAICSSMSVAANEQFQVTCRTAFTIEKDVAYPDDVAITLIPEIRDTSLYSLGCEHTLFE